MIRKLRILPPLAFARFGTSKTPQDNYTLEVNADDPLGFRMIVPADTLHVDEAGNIRRLPAPNSKPTRDEINSIFRDRDGRIRPVAPYFEVFAITNDGILVPLTEDLLAKDGLDASAVSWNVHVENRKVYRRTGDQGDIVRAETDWFGTHDRKQLRGNCPYFKDAFINFGSVQFIKPRKDADDPVVSQIRLRFTPGPGDIYGPRDCPKTNDVSEPFLKRIYKGGSWTEFDEETPNKGGPRETLPPSLYAIRPPAPPWLNGNHARSRGYFDDACDGFVEVKIRGKPNLKAKARICVGPPSFVPDCQFVRTLDDDLDQIVHGPHAADIDPGEAKQRALDIVRRAHEAVRFMNIRVMNGNSIKGRPPAEFDSMPAEESFGTDRAIRPVMPPASVDTKAVLALHQQVYATLSAGAAPWFLGLLRRPDEIGDLTNHGRRKMPALMSGADSFYLALTYRQIATIEQATTQKVSEPKDVVALTPRNLSAQLRYVAAGNPINSRPEMAIANCCPGLEVDFRAVWRRIFENIELSEYDNYVVKGNVKGRSGKKISLTGHRLLRIGGGASGKIEDGKAVIVTLKESAASNPTETVTVRSDRNPHGVWTMEWSNCLAHIVAAVRTGKTHTVECEFTRDPAPTPLPIGVPTITVDLNLIDFFESPDSAVISEGLAEPGELTQGLCSPWQNDLRECSCYYWASSRPDFVNTEIKEDGLTHGDNWFSQKRTGEYVADDYADTRLINYDNLFNNWGQLQFQIGGKDSDPGLHTAAPSEDP
jgi:hypothetical protein